MHTIRRSLAGLGLLTAVLAACNSPAPIGDLPGGQVDTGGLFLTPVTPVPSVGTPVSLWSDSATWGGTVPGKDTAVVIPAGKRVVLDRDASVRNITVLGTLEFAEADLNLTSDYLLVEGALHIGSQAAPFKHKATLTLTGTSSENVMNMGSRGILVMGGAVDLYGQAPFRSWTRLAENAPAGSTALHLKDTVNWKAGDRLVVAPTDFYNDGAEMHSPETEQLDLATGAGDRLTLKTPVSSARWGALQYATDSGVSLSPGTLSLPSTRPDAASPGRRDTGGTIIPTVLDERAEVGNLTRNIVVQGADDDAWKNEGYGAQVMAMGPGSGLHLDGVELRRAGQVGLKGRYPVHFHNQSYDASGRELGDVHNVVQNSVVWNSSQRCMVIHGTNGVTLKDNICYDVKGHAIFLEDAVERRNTIQGNLILKVRQPATPLLLHEGNGSEFGTSSGMWLTNPDNTVRGNAVADVVGHGYWLAFPESPLGQNRNVSLNDIHAQPNHLPFGVFEDNVAHTVGGNGVFLDGVPRDSEVGETTGMKYIPVQGGQPDTDRSQRLRFTLARVSVYKNGMSSQGYTSGGGLWNRNSAPNFLEWVSADHLGGWFAGAGDDGLIARSLMIGTSLNSGIHRTASKPLAAVASYHSTFDITQNVILGFPFAEGTDNEPAGVFMTGDYYITGVDLGLVRNPDNVLVQSSPGRRVLPSVNEHWTLAGALWDANGYWGPKGNYWVYDESFFTAGTSCVVVAPAGKNGQSCAGPYYGVGNLSTDFDKADDYAFMTPLEVTRQDTVGATLGSWKVGDGRSPQCPKLCWMRHFAGLSGGRFLLRFPNNDDAGGNPVSGYQTPSWFSAEITNLQSAGDEMLLGVAFNPALTPKIALSTGNPTDAGGQDTANTRQIDVIGSSLNAVRLDQAGKTYWQDRSGKVVWMKLKGGLKVNDYWDDNSKLYKPMTLKINAP